MYWVATFFGFYAAYAFAFDSLVSPVRTDNTNKSAYGGSNDNEKKIKYELNAKRKLGIVDTKFNNNNKIIARAISTNSKMLGTISKEQYATKGSTSIDQIITKICYIDHDQSKKPCFELATCDLEK